MGQPVVHFEVISRDGPAMRAFYSSLFDWRIDADNPEDYGLIAREENVSNDGRGIGGGIGVGPQPIRTIRQSRRRRRLPSLEIWRDKTKVHSPLNPA